MKNNNTSIKTYWRPLDKILSQDTTAATEQIGRVRGNIAASQVILAENKDQQEKTASEVPVGRGMGEWHTTQTEAVVSIFFFLILDRSQRFV